MRDRRSPRGIHDDDDGGDDRPADAKPSLWQRLFGRRASDGAAASDDAPLGEVDGGASVPIDPRQAFIEEVRALRAQRRTDEAIFMLESAVHEDPSDADLHSELHLSYVRAADPYATLAHGQRWVAALAKAGRMRDALQALRELYMIDEDFKLADGDAAVPLAKLAMKDGARELAVGLVDGFDQRFPRHPQLPTMYFLGARLLTEHWLKHQAAAQMIRSIVAHFGHDPIAAEAKAYLVALEARIEAERS